MYDTFYGMTEKPFQISTDPRFLWFGEQQREALANLKYGVLDRNGFIVLTGDMGTGKTTLVNALLDSLDDHVIVVRINHPSLEIHEFMALVARILKPEVSISDKSGLLVFLNTYLQQAHADGKVVLLIIDEAQRLSVELMEEIRLLSNIEHSGEKLLSIIFVGQNEIKQMLMAPQCRALYQRITSFYDIQGLTREETRQYVEHRLKVSGTFENFFTSAALHKIHGLSRGIPRVINVLCDRALLTGYVNNCRIIDADIIAECAHELDLGAQRNGMHKWVLAGKTISQWRDFSKRLTTRRASIQKILHMKLQQLKSIWKTAVASMRLGARNRWHILEDTTGDVRDKFWQKIHPFALPVGLATISLVVIFGAYIGIKEPNTLQDDATQREKPPNRVIAAAPGEEALKPYDLRDDTQFERFLAVVSPPSSPELNRESSVSGRSPIVEEALSTDQEQSFAPKQTYVAEAKAALAQGDHQKALELLETYPVGAADEEIEAVELYAHALVGRAGEIMAVSPIEAEALLRKATEVAPKMAIPYIMLGERYRRTNDYPRAIDAYQNAVHLDPTASDAYFNLGFIYATTGAYGEAERAFAKVVQLRPSYLGKALFNLAVVQQKLGKNDESIANLEEVLTMGPENKKALAYLNQLRNSSTVANVE